MLHPSYTDLLSTINDRHKSDAQLASRYSIVIAAAKRARQLVDGEEPLNKRKSPRPLSNAVWELYEGHIDVV